MQFSLYVLRNTNILTDFSVAILLVLLFSGSTICFVQAVTALSASKSRWNEKLFARGNGKGVWENNRGSWD